MYQFNEEVYRKRMAWFEEARFGMFIHFGLYSIPARGEWVFGNEEMKEEDYAPYFREFNPDLLSMKEWAKLCKKAGMKYAVMTAKHHDGFCLFDTKFTDFNSLKAPCGRDLVREFVDAMRGEGIKVGLYYSLIDWRHQDFPHYGDNFHPDRNRKEEVNEGRDFQRYIDYFHGQVRELCSNYGKLDLLWFDFSYGDMRGEKWKATELIDMVRSLQKDVIINNRLEVSGEGYGSLQERSPSPFHGDFVTPEQMIPPVGIRDIHGKSLPWEACVTMNDSWGYTEKDRNFKSGKLLIQKLVECVSKGGNMILNVGPDARGRIPREEVERLEEIGEWMRDNGKSIYGCKESSLPKPEYGRYTENGNKIYFHILEDTIGPLPLSKLKKEEVGGIRWLYSGAEVPISSSWVHSDYPDILFADTKLNGTDQNPVGKVLEIIRKEK